jgi:hypothetical protein
MDILAASAEVLAGAGFSTSLVSVEDRRALTFEDNTVLGFLFAYDDPALLIECWSKDADKAVAAHQFALRRAAKKAWNAYVVLLTDREPDYVQSVALSAIEEDLAGTRKIAQAGIVDVAELRKALLPLLPFQSAPRLEAVDIVAEIRQRTTELPSRAVNAFLSDADESVVIQVLEEKT